MSDKIHNDEIELFKLIARAVVSGCIGVVGMVTWPIVIIKGNVVPGIIGTSILTFTIAMIFYGDKIFTGNQKRDNTNS